jgi:hypothetical protein
MMYYFLLTISLLIYSDDLRLPKMMIEIGILESDIEIMAKEVYKTSLPGIQRWNLGDVIESDIFLIFKAVF